MTFTRITHSNVCFDLRVISTSSIALFFSSIFYFLKKNQQNLYLVKKIKTKNNLNKQSLRKILLIIFLHNNDVFGIIFHRSNHIFGCGKQANDVKNQKRKMVGNSIKKKLKKKKKKKEKKKGKCFPLSFVYNFLAKTVWEDRKVSHFVLFL